MALARSSQQELYSPSTSEQLPWTLLLAADWRDQRLSRTPSRVNVNLPVIPIKPMQTLSRAANCAKQRNKAAASFIARLVSQSFPPKVFGVVCTLSLPCRPLVAGKLCLERENAANCNCSLNSKFPAWFPAPIQLVRCLQQRTPALSNACLCVRFKMPRAVVSHSGVAVITLYYHYQRRLPFREAALSVARIVRAYRPDSVVGFRHAANLAKRDRRGMRQRGLLPIPPIVWRPRKLRSAACAPVVASAWSFRQRWARAMTVSCAYHKTGGASGRTVITLIAQQRRLILRFDFVRDDRSPSGFFFPKSLVC